MSPPLYWANVPAEARSFVLVVDDPDAPDPAAPRMRFVHWVVYDIPADCVGLPEGVTADSLPPGAREGVNDFKQTGYRGPCPPHGRHRYVHTLYALDTALGDIGAPPRDVLLETIRDHVLSSATLTGLYERRP
jgi:Raf kinase inhibitor-like YbhB/YbcL family protein